MFSTDVHFLADMPVKPELIDILKQLYYTAAADKWEDIGIMLNIKIGDLNVIKSADGNKTSHSCLREMFKLYLEKDNPPPSWAAIVEVLEFLEEGTLAENIKSKHCSNQSKVCSCDTSVCIQLVYVCINVCI